MERIERVEPGWVRVGADSWGEFCVENGFAQANSFRLTDLSIHSFKVLENFEALGRETKFAQGK